MAIQIETKGLSNGKTLVQSYNSLTGYEKYDLKSYSVSDDKKDEFVKAFGGKDMVKYDLEIRKIIELLKEYNK